MSQKKNFPVFHSIFNFWHQLETTWITIGILFLLNKQRVLEFIYIYIYIYFFFLDRSQHGCLPRRYARLLLTLNSRRLGSFIVGHILFIYRVIRYVNINVTKKLCVSCASIDISCLYTAMIYNYQII
jgi:hypothetical protein